jgi:hypothetical protein
MAWEFTDKTGQFRSVGGKDLQQLVNDGLIGKETRIKSTTSGRVSIADNVNGLKWPDEDSQESGDSYLEGYLEGYSVSSNEPLPAVEWPKEPPQTATPPNVPKDESTGIFDLGFRSAMTPALVSALWGTWLTVGAGGVALMAIGTGLQARSGGSVPQMVAAVAAYAVAYLLVSVVVRIFSECVIVLFRIADYLKRMK